MKTIHQIVTLTEGFIALCLGSSDRVVWVNQSDASVFSDGEKIYLPQPSGLEGELELLLGLALREVAKIQFTVGSVLADMPPELMGYACAVEDARIKQEISHDFLGAASIFNSATTVLHKVYEEKLSTGEANPVLAKHLAVWAIANDAYLSTPESDLASCGFIELASSFVDPQKFKKVEGLAYAGPWLKSTAAVSACAERIQLLLSDEPQENEPQQAEDTEQSQESKNDKDDSEQASKTPDSNESGDEGSAEDNSSNQQDDANESDSGTQGADDGAGEQASTGDDAGAGEGAGNSDAGAENADAVAQSGTPSESTSDASSTENSPQSAVNLSGDPMNNALAMLKGHAGAAQASLPTPEQVLPAVEIDDSLVESIREALSKPDPIAEMMQIAVGVDHSDDAETDTTDSMDDDSAVEMLNSSPQGGKGFASLPDCAGNRSLGSIPGRLVNVLLREFQDKRPKSQFRAQSGRDLDVSHLWRLKAVGDTRVFRKKSPSGGIDAAVWLLLDRSGSMHDDFDLAANSCNAFAQALQRISGVQTAMSLFPGFGEVTTDVLKFRQSTLQSAAKLKSVTASGGTPTDEAILEILPKLLLKPVHKRVIVLITDGEPDHAVATQEAIAYAISMGVDVIGIGIGQDARINRIVSRSISIKEISELPSSLEKLFKTELSQSLLAV